MKEYIYKDESVFSKFLMVLIVISIALNAAAVFSSFLEYNLLISVRDGMELSDEQAFANDSRQMVIGIAQVIFAVFTAVIFCMWTYRMSRNAHSIKDNNLQYTPGWAVGYYFIPIVNLWKPYQALKESYEAFTDRINDTMVLPLWWGAWIVSNILGRLVFRQSLKADGLDELINASLITIGSDAFDLVLDLIAVFMVYTVSKACAERFEVDEFKEATVEWE
tara:strand:- start:89211 stop:89873 length:663 start_codon:yes stop_codon:yes gene_type:complete